MDTILAIPFELRMLLVFVAGTLLGGQLNRGIYGLAYLNPRPISPWSSTSDKSLKRTWLDRVPVFGWWRLRRESATHGVGFWLRPMLIELACGVGFAWLYSWEISGGTIPIPPGISDADLGMLHVQFMLHVALISLMIVATFIDFDEQTIPDSITVTGTLLALVAAGLWPISNLPIVVSDLDGKHVSHLLVNSPEPLPPAWLFESTGLWCAIACLVAWCLALLPKTWTLRYGPIKAFKYLVASVLRPRRKTTGTMPTEPRRPFIQTVTLGAIAVLGTAGIFAIWLAGGGGWISLFSALVGMVFGGGMIWGVRIVGGGALGKEAMGFGDVTLMAMIGAFLGWQPALMIFFLAPFAALFIAVAQLVITRRSDIAFGPYLCLATLLLVLNWKSIWNDWARKIFEMGWYIPIAVGVCLVLMGAMLFGWRLLRERILPAEE